MLGKTLSLVILAKINLFIESNNILVREQAGFRTREQCVGQAIALYEIVRRRQINKLPTFALFIDLKKAYDSVPHQALMVKLLNVGVDGWCHHLIGEMYCKCRFQVRVRDGVFSDSMPYDKGVRQGCPLSPLLFNIFINDIFDSFRSKGVAVPGIDECVPGLLFADDLVLLAESPEQLHLNFMEVVKWCEKWEMAINPEKCGVCVFHGAVEHWRSLSNMDWVVNNVAIPITEKYTYLGISFDCNVSKMNMAEERVGVGRRALSSWSRVLTNTSVPLRAKVRIIKSMVVPTMTYGATLFGMASNLFTSQQKVLDDGLCMCVGLGSRSNIVSRETVRRELGCDNLCGLAAGARAKAFLKFKSLRTWIQVLCESPMKSRSDTWVTGTQKWLNRYGPENWKSLTPHWRLRKEVIRVMAQRMWNTRRGKSGDQFVVNGFHNNLILDDCIPSNLAFGAKWVSRLRMGAFWSAPKLASIGYIGFGYKNMCPCCEKFQAETLQHFLLHCERWEQFRGWPPVSKRHYEDDTGLITHYLLGGENLSGDLHGDWMKPRSWSEENRVQVHLCKFLKNVIPIRSQILKKLISQNSGAAE